MTSSGRSVLEQLQDHDAWATRELLEVCQGLSDEQLDASFDIGPGTLRATMLHIIGCMRRWTDRISGAELRPSVEDDGQTWSIEDMIKLLEASDAELRVVARDSNLADTIEVQFQGMGEPIRFTKQTAFIHLATHGVHHRAQVLNMLRRGGVEGVPDVDAIEEEIRD